jgi:hypothetical protein
MSRLAMEQTGDDFLSALTHTFRVPTGVAIIDHLRSLERCLLWMLKRNCPHFFAPAWIQLVSDLTPFIQRLWSENLRTSASELTARLDTAGQVAIDISTRFNRWDDVLACALVGVSLALPISDPNAIAARFDAAEKIIGTISDRCAREQGMAALKENRQLVQTATPTIQDEIQRIREMAAAMGVDLSDETDPIADVVRIGLADLNPERVLKTCQHLFVQPGSIGIPGEMLGLWSAGSKQLLCVKHGYGFSSLSLDSIYALMDQMYCTKCPDRSPHPTDWRWSHEWQEAQHKLHAAKSRQKNPAAGL